MGIFEQIDKRRYLIYVFLIAITLAVYGQVVGFEYILFDDNKYVSENPAVMAGVNKMTIQWAFTAFAEANYHPLTWISLMFDTDLAKILSIFWDVDTGPSHAYVYHAINLLFHIANVLLLFLVISKMTGRVWRSAFIAALFAIHPQHVESVAWIAERKDVLSTLFWLLTMLAYTSYVETNSKRSYWLAIGAFFLGLLAKPMLVTLPVILLLLDYWPLNRFARDEKISWSAVKPLVIEKIPYFVLSLLSSIITFIAQRVGGAVGTLAEYPIGVRFANALVSYFKYIWKTFWPVDLSIFYMHPGTSIPAWKVLAAFALLVGITVLSIRLAKRKPYFIVGWLWYLITLLPVIGIIHVGYKAMADRYMYVPHIGFFILVVWIVLDIITKNEQKRLSRPAIVALSLVSFVILAALGVRCYDQAKYWRNGISIFSRAIELEPNDPHAHFNLAANLERAQCYEESEKHLRIAIKLVPDYVDAHYNMGVILALQDKMQESERWFKKTINLNPRYAPAYKNIAVIYAQNGDYKTAIKYFSKALKYDPYNPEIKKDLENAKAMLAGEMPE